MNISWKQLGVVKVAAKAEGIWQLALEYVGGLRLLRLRVVDQDENRNAVWTTWHQTATDRATADGLIHVVKTGLLLTSAPPGALIAKIGGSTADVPDAASPSAPYGTKKVFAVGSYCVVNLAAQDAGPLFMAMNDSLDNVKHHEGALHVAIEEYLL